MGTRHTVKSVHAEMAEANQILHGRIDQLEAEIRRLQDERNEAKAQPRQTTMPIDDDDRNPPVDIYDDRPAAASSGGNSTDSPIAFFKRCRNTYGSFVNAKLSREASDEELLVAFNYEGGKVTRHLDKRGQEWANVYPANPNGGAA